MKSRFILFRRARVYDCEDTTARKQTGLKTEDKAEALALLHARNESFRRTRLNVQIARAYLTAGDPNMSARIWQAVTHPGILVRKFDGRLPPKDQSHETIHRPRRGIEE